LCAVLKRAGLSIVAIYASAGGAPFEPAASATMWVIAEREDAIT